MRAAGAVSGAGALGCSCSHRSHAAGCSRVQGGRLPRSGAGRTCLHAPPCEASATLEPHAHRRMRESPGLQQANWQALLCLSAPPIDRWALSEAPHWRGWLQCRGGRAGDQGKRGWRGRGRITWTGSLWPLRAGSNLPRVMGPSCGCGGLGHRMPQAVQAPPAAPAAALLTEAVAWGCLVSVHRQAADALRQRRPPRLPGPAALPPAAGVGPHSSGAVAGELAGLCHTGSDQTMTNGRRGVQLP